MSRDQNDSTVFVVHGDIGWAVEQMRDGRCVRRAGWNGKGMWLALEIPGPDSRMDLPFVCIRTVTGQLVPWVCSQTDLLAKDWEFAEPGA
jgi:hypothetical protein